MLAAALAACEPADQLAHDSGVHDHATRLRIASLSFPQSPWHALWLRFAQRLQAADLDAFALELFIAGELGSEETALANIRRGRIQIGGFSLQGLATVTPELSVLLMPYLFESAAEVDFVIDNYLTAAYRALLQAKGLALLQWSEVGWVQVYADRPLPDPQSARGLAMRASNALGSRYFAAALGADLIPITFSEVVPALQTGLVDSGQSGVGMYALAGIAAEARHLNMTYHAFDSGVIVANLAWFDSLSEQQRGLILQAMDEVGAARAAIRAAIAEIEHDLPGMGVHVHYIDAEMMVRWQAVGLATHQAMLDEIGGQAQRIYDLVQQGKAAFREGKGPSE